jgi:hypothetical protein
LRAFTLAQQENILGIAGFVSEGKRWGTSARLKLMIFDKGYFKFAIAFVR